MGFFFALCAVACLDEEEAKVIVEPEDGAEAEVKVESEDDSHGGAATAFGECRSRTRKTGNNRIETNKMSRNRAALLLRNPWGAVGMEAILVPVMRQSSWVKTIISGEKGIENSNLKSHEDRLRRA